MTVRTSWTLKVALTALLSLAAIPAWAQDPIEFRTGGADTLRMSITDTEVKLAASVTFNANSNKITSLADPTLAQDAATKNYVDTQLGGTTGPFVKFTPASVQGDASANPSIYINDTGGGNLLHLQSGGTDRFVVGNTGAVTSGTWNGSVIGVAYGGTGAGTFTQGSVVFAGASGVYTQDNPNLFWDDGNNRLGIGTSGPLSALSVGGAGNTLYGAYINATSTADGSFGLYVDQATPALPASWAAAVRGQITSGTGYACGVQGRSTRAAAVASGRSYGVYGEGNNATANYNYGVYGRLSGSNAGAAVVGWDSINQAAWSGSTGGTWAGYFVGDVNIRNARLYVDKNFGGTPLIDLAVGDTDTGFNSAADGDLDIYSNNSIVMSIYDMAGPRRVGILTTNPSTTLDVNGVVNSATGYRIADGATSGNYLRGNGTNFVSSAIQSGDIPSGSGYYLARNATDTSSAAVAAGYLYTLSNTSGTGTGVISASATAGVGVYGSGTTYGVQGSTATNAAYGVFGSNTNATAGGFAFGVRGEATGGNGLSHYGVYGHAEGAATNNYGVYGVANVVTAGTNYGVVGLASNGATNWAGYFTGNVNVTGALTLGTALAVSSGGTGATTLTGMLKGNGASAFSAVTGTAGYATYWSDANTIAAEQYLGVGRGGTGAGAFTQGSVVFAGASGVYTQDNSGLFWADSTNRLGIGTAVPGTSLHIDQLTPTVTLQSTSAANIAGDDIAMLDFRSDYGTTEARILVEAGTARSGGDYPTDIVFYNTPDTSTILTERMRIRYDGTVSIAGDLTVGGTGPYVLKTGDTMSGTLTSSLAGVAYRMENTATLQAKNSAGSYETWMWPRWSDNNTYLNFGSGNNFYIRTNASGTVGNFTNVGLLLGNDIYFREDDSATDPGYPWYRSNGGYAIFNSSYGVSAANNYGLMLNWDNSDDMSLCQGGGYVSIGAGSSTPGSLLEVRGQARASSLYDYDNTAYYLDPSATGTSLNTAGSVITVQTSTAAGSAAVRGTESGASGAVYGVHGVATASSGGQGVRGEGYQYGVFGTSSTLSSSSAGVYGESTASGLADVRGVRGYSKPADYWGIGGQFEGGYKGVYALCSGGSDVYTGVESSASAGASGAAYGVDATASTGASGTARGVDAYASAGASGTAYGIYASAFASGASIFWVATGTGGGTWGNGTTCAGDGYNTYYHDTKSQSIYLASDLTAVGMGAGNITEIRLWCRQTSGQAVYNTRIRMKLTGASTLAAFDNTGLTLVYGPSGSYTPTAGSVYMWIFWESGCQR